MFNHLKKLTALICIAFVGFPIIGAAQDGGAFDLRLLIHSVECYNDIVYCDIQIRAEELGEEFRLGYQRYKVSFNRAALADPFVDEQLYVSGLVYEPGEYGFSAYNTYNFFVTDTIAVYTLPFAGGDGVYVGAEEYIDVVRLGFYVIDFTESIDLELRPTEELFSTIINLPNNVSESLSGTYLNYRHNINGACGNEPPQAAYNNQITAEGQPITICVAENDSDPEDRLDTTSVELLSMPPASEGELTLDTQTGCMTFTPHPDFSGVVTTFEYQICDEGVYIPSYGGSENPNPLPLPDPNDPPIISYDPACDTATVTITVDATLVGTTDGDASFFSLTTFPNPANDVLNIHYQLLEKADVSLAIWNMLGQPVIELPFETQTADNYYQQIDVSHLNTGYYRMLLRVDDRHVTRLVRID